MSASLVGSEMCIRDSLKAANSPAGRRPSSPIRGRRGGRWDTRPGCARPVSYTHLTLPTICSV
eukprot:9023481-Alexandrium_andersonii.AAC.1